MAGAGAGTEGRGGTTRPAYAYVLRALREARGVTQEGWAAILSYSVATVRRWETGSAVPPAEAEAADVSMALRRRGYTPYRLTLDAENHAWIAVVIDWKRAA